MRTALLDPGAMTPRARPHSSPATLPALRRPRPMHREKDLARILRACHRQTAAGGEVSGVLAEAVATVASRSVSVFYACDVISSATATSAPSKKPAATATLMSLVTRSSKTATTDEDSELATLEKME